MSGKPSSIAVKAVSTSGLHWTYRKQVALYLKRCISQTNLAVTPIIGQHND